MTLREVKQRCLEIYSDPLLSPEDKQMELTGFLLESERNFKRRSINKLLNSLVASGIPVDDLDGIRLFVKLKD